MDEVPAFLANIVDMNSVSSVPMYTFNIDKINQFIDQHLDAIIENENTNLLMYQNKPVYWNQELLVIPFAPKYPLSHFSREGCNIFLSKKKPLLICAVLANQQETEDALRADQNSKFEQEVSQEVEEP